MAKTKNMNIRIAESEYEAIKQFADFNGKSISALMLDAIREQIEYWEDMKAIAEYEREKENGTLVTYSLKEVMEELALDKRGWVQQTLVAVPSLFVNPQRRIFKEE